MTHTHNPAKHAAALLAAAALILCLLIAPAAALEGSGTEASPYLISSLTDLQSFRDSVNSGATTSGKYWQLSTDIDLSGITWSPIGTDSITFKGTFDGNGHTISNVIISNNQRQNGLFSINNGFIKNLYVNTISITSSYSSSQATQLLHGAGGITGINTGDIINCAVYDLSISGYSISTNWQSLGCGGIAGVNGGDINNCIVSDFSNIGTSAILTYVGGITGINGKDASNTNVNALISQTIVFDSILSTSSSTGRSGGIVGVAFAGSTNNNVMLSKSTSANVAGRIVGISDGGTHNDYALSSVSVDSGMVVASSVNGQDITTTQATSESFYLNTLGWDFENTWYWDDTAEWQAATGITYSGLPKLQVFILLTPPTISAVTASPATGGQLTEYTLSATATTEAAGGITGYQWAYSTDSGSTWQSISGATTNPYTWTPGQSISGTVNLKVTVTGADGGTADSYAEGFTPTITVVTPPTISSITTSRPLQKVGSETTLTAIFADSQTGNTYQWYYRVSGGSWQAITGATEPVSSFTPSVTGTLDIKIIATNAYSESSELSTTLTVLPTYTPTQISNTTVDINIPGTAKFQAQTQFTLSADLKALEYFDTTRAHLAHDNALYYLDSGEKQIIPLAETTGNTISSCYVGQYTGVITDISGNTAFYNYQTNDWQYIEQNSAAVLASTTTYAATISGTTLNLYNLNGNKVDDIESTLTNLAGNDAANTFAGYSGQTLTYYWITGNQLSSGSQTMAHTITDVHQVPGTENYVVSTTANTYIVSISSSGAYSQVMETDTADPLLHTQATTINVLIGVADPNEIYVVGSDGETDGTYVSGSTLTDASIAKSTGLYAIAGGADYQAYILGKSESSTWQLTQVISFGEAVDFSQISTTGTYAAVATGLKLYLLEAVDVSTGTYMLQGVIISSSSKPYAGKMVSINGDNIRTDSSGRFLYPVQPNVLYTIIADTTTKEYTATNAALQQIAIQLKPNPFAQSVSYSATYNADTGNFEMVYQDDRELTESVTWIIRETGNSTIVHQVTAQAGQTVTWAVPFDKVFTGYQITMDAERGAVNVENVWLITPSGSQPINIPGLDDTGKSIIFGCLLMIIAGLFGVMFSTKGAIFVVLAAGLMTFLGLLAIPWEIIMVAGLLAVLAALAKGGGGQ